MYIERDPAYAYLINDGDNHMTYYVTALTNDKAKLIVSELRVSGRHAEQTAIEVRNMWVKLGYDVVTRTEG